jgi:hypothetical protein
MKKMSKYRLLAFLFAATVFFAACTKDNQEVRLAPKLSTSQVLNVKSDSATVIGFVVAEGDGFTEKGVCYNTAEAPTITNSKTVYTGAATTATFAVKLGGLAYATKYYTRAYATGAGGTIYGEEFSFTTLPVVPTLTTAVISVITGKTATGGGNVTVAGGATVTARGVCFAITRNPKITDSKTSDGNGTGAFVSALAGLKGNTIYYVRSYATNSAGTGYGPEVTFTTLVDLPTLTTVAITNVSGTGATSGGNITDDGGGSVTGKGVCWSTLANPTIADSKTTDGTGKGIFASTITGLSLSTTYHVRAYAINSVGVAYGPDIQFSTFPTTLFMIGNGVGGWDWATVDLPMVPVNSHPNLFWKIVWMEATGEFKFAPQKAWVGDFGKTGTATGGVYDKGGDNIPVPGTAGYYMVVVDFSTNKIAIATPKVYLMGNTIGSWDTANPAGLFTVDNTNSLVTITKTLAADELRMYAWHPWFTDWWQSEFIFLGGKIAFRGTGGDQARVTVTAGPHTVNLNFKTGDAAIL